MQAHLSDEWSGTVVFGLNTNEFGVITSLCVWGGNMGETTDFAQCAGRAILESGSRFEQNLRQQRYSVTFVYD